MLGKKNLTNILSRRRSIKLNFFRKVTLGGAGEGAIRELKIGNIELQSF